MYISHQHTQKYPRTINNWNVGVIGFLMISIIISELSTNKSVVNDRESLAKNKLDEGFEMDGELLNALRD